MAEGRPLVSVDLGSGLYKACKSCIDTDLTKEFPLCLIGNDSCEVESENTYRLVVHPGNGRVFPFLDLNIVHAAPNVPCVARVCDVDLAVNEDFADFFFLKFILLPPLI